MKKINQLTLLLSVLLFSCNQGTQLTPKKNPAAKVSDAGIEFKDQPIEQVYLQYIAVKNALVESNAQKAKEASVALAKGLTEIKGCENTAKEAKEISESADLKLQREKFTILSSDLIALLKNADIKTGKAFVQYCPMANNGKGGYWLASEEKISNPYYGDEMLTCGEVKEELKQAK